MAHELLRAIALLMIIEGIFPFVSPRRFRIGLLYAAQMTEIAWRVVGLGSMLLGLLFLKLL